MAERQCPIQLETKHVRRPFFCPYCGNLKFFHTYDTYKQHVRRHRKIVGKPIYCRSLQRRKSAKPRSSNLLRNLNFDFIFSDTFSEVDVYTLMDEIMSNCSEETTFFCSSCDLSFSSQHILQQHEKNEHSEHSNGEFKCSSCDKVFASKQNQQEHEKMQFCSKLTECERCNLTFKTLGKMRLHQSNCHSYQCSTCPVTFSTRAKWLRHERAHKNHKQYKCPHCVKAFSDKKYFEGHVISHESGERPFKCYMCTSSFFTLANKLQHEKTHQGIRPYQCQVCGAAFVAKAKLTRHEQSHENYKQYICQYCQKTFSDKIYFTAHEQMHESGERPYKCLKCPSSFIVRNHLKQHEKSHTTLRLFQCEQCAASFPTNARLKRHINGHLNFKKYQCTHCLKSFSNLKYLAAHKKVHEIEELTSSTDGNNDIDDTVDLTETNKNGQEFKCRHCSKLFHSQSYLNAHEKSHSGARPFKCDLCDSAYMIRSHLTAHVKLHTNEKAFICDRCGKAFPTNSRLKRHMKARVEGKECRRYGKGCERKRDPSDSKFACDICGKFYSSNALLSRHLKSHTKHDDIPNFLESSGEDSKCKCGTSFETEELFKSHVLNTHSSSTNPSSRFCPVCECNFKSLNTLHKHIKKHHALYPCQICTVIFKTEEELSKHLDESEHGGDTKTKCPLCEKETFIDDKEIADHLQDLHGNDKPYVCATCGEGYWGKDAIKTHVNDTHSSVVTGGSSCIIKCKIGAMVFSPKKNQTMTGNNEMSCSDSPSDNGDEALVNDSNDQRSVGAFGGVNKIPDIDEGNFTPFSPLLGEQTMDQTIPNHTMGDVVHFEGFNKVIENQSKVDLLETFLNYPKSKQLTLDEEGSEAVQKCLVNLGGQEVDAEEMTGDEQGDFSCESCGMNFMHKKSWVLHNQYQHDDGEASVK